MLVLMRGKEIDSMEAQSYKQAVNSVKPDITANTNQSIAKLR